MIKKLKVDVLGGVTSAWQYGDADGQLVVLVHGFRGDHHGLQGIATEMARLAPELRIVVPDLPGFGETPSIAQRSHDLHLFGEWLSAFVDSQRQSEWSRQQGFAILGHSFGSLVVANSLSQGLAPTRTVLINPIAAPALEGPKGMLSKLALMYYRVADLLSERAARRLLGNPIIVRIMSETMTKTRDKELRAWIHGQHDSYFSRFADSASLLQSFQASISHTVGEYAESFRCPTLLIAGDCDDITPLEEQLALSRRLSNSKIRIIPGVGHLVHYEAVDYAVAEVLAFLRGEQ